MRIKPRCIHLDDEGLCNHPKVRDYPYDELRVCMEKRLTCLFREEKKNEKINNSRH